MKPSKPITDASFRYVPSVSTDIRKTFSRIEAQRKAQEAQQQQAQQRADTFIQHCSHPLAA